MQRHLRCGCSLVEMIVALLLLSIGVLALVASAAVIARDLATNGIRAAAARTASNRIETIAAACQSAGGGSESVGPTTSTWSVTPLPSGHISVSAGVSYPTPRGTRTDAYTAIVGCR